MVPNYELSECLVPMSTYLMAKCENCEFVKGKNTNITNIVLLFSPLKSIFEVLLGHRYARPTHVPNESPDHELYH